MQKIITYLWFNNEAEEAAKFYTSVFRNSGITEIIHYTPRFREVITMIYRNQSEKGEGNENTRYENTNEYWLESVP